MSPITLLLLPIIIGIILSMLALAPRQRFLIAIGLVVLLLILIPALLLPVVIGLIICLLALLPPLHTLSKLSATVRLSLAFILGLTSFTILCGSMTYFGAYQSYAAGEYHY